LDCIDQEEMIEPSHDTHHRYSHLINHCIALNQSAIGNATGLVQFFLDNNRLHGSIPASMLDLPTIVEMYVESD